MAANPEIAGALIELERIERELNTDYARAIQGEVKSVAGNWLEGLRSSIAVLRAASTLKSIAVICDLRVGRKEASVSVVSAFTEESEAMSEATKLAETNVVPNRVFTVHKVKLKGAE